MVKILSLENLEGIMTDRDGMNIMNMDILGEPTTCPIVCVVSDADTYEEAYAEAAQLAQDKYNTWAEKQVTRQRLFEEALMALMQ